MLYALRTLLNSLGIAVGHPRVLLTAWLVVTIPAIVHVYPVYLELDDALGQHPAASVTLDQSLDADFARLHPEARVPLTGGSIFALLAFAFLAGGILRCVGTGRRCRFSEFLAECARLFLRNIRVLLIGTAFCMLLFWGAGWLDRMVREEWAYGLDPGSIFGWRSPWLSLELALDALRWFWGFLFLCVVLVSKMAMADLAIRDRRCALAAWLRALRSALWHPLQTGGFVALWAFAWLGVTYLIGEVTVYVLEVRGHLGWGLLSGQIGILWTLIVVISAFLGARRLALSESEVHGVEALDPDAFAESLSPGTTK